MSLELPGASKEEQEAVSPQAHLQADLPASKPLTFMQSKSEKLSAGIPRYGRVPQLRLPPCVIDACLLNIRTAYSVEFSFTEKQWQSEVFQSKSLDFHSQVRGQEETADQWQVRNPALFMQCMNQLHFLAVECQLEQC